MQVSEAPPLAPFLPNLDQERFLTLHTKHIVTKWSWHFQETMLRACTDRGLSASLSRDDADELVRAGLMEWGFGCADIRAAGTVDKLRDSSMVIA